MYTRQPCSPAQSQQKTYALLYPGESSTDFRAYMTASAGSDIRELEIPQHMRGSDGLPRVPGAPSHILGFCVCATRREILTAPDWTNHKAMHGTYGIRCPTFHHVHISPLAPTTNSNLRQTAVVHPSRKSYHRLAWSLRTRCHWRTPLPNKHLSFGAPQFIFRCRRSRHPSHPAPPPSSCNSIKLTLQYSAHPYNPNISSPASLPSFWTYVLSTRLTFRTSMPVTSTSRGASADDKSHTLHPATSSTSSSTAGAQRTTFPVALLAAIRAAPLREQYVLSCGTRYTAQAFLDISRAVATSLLSLGLSPFCTVGIYGMNSLEWFAADIGSTLACLVPVGIPHSSRPAMLTHIINHSEATVLFVSGKINLEKFLAVRSKCPHVQRVVVWGAFRALDYDYLDPLVLGWPYFLSLGADISLKQLNTRVRLSQPDDMCKLVYTPGTTGLPKAVMLSHDNVLFTVATLAQAVKPGQNERLLSFLPASRILANVMDIAFALLHGIQVHFAPATVLKGSLMSTLKTVRPTVFLGVPQVFDRIMEKTVAATTGSSAMRSALSTWAMPVGHMSATQRGAGRRQKLGWSERTRQMMLRKTQKKIGLEECHTLLNFGKPLALRTDAFFKSVGLAVQEVYGTSEATGVLTMSVLGYHAHTMGRPVSGVRVYVRDADRSGEGELCFKGRNAFMGYKNDEAGTARVRTEDGFVCTGDVGRVDGEGNVTVTRRAAGVGGESGGEPTVAGWGDDGGERAGECGRGLGEGRGRAAGAGEGRGRAGGGAEGRGESKSGLGGAGEGG